MVGEWRRLLCVLRQRGQSEVLGATLLTGIMVILVATAGVFIFADFDEDEEQLLANVEGEVTASGITLAHDGGDTFPAGEVAVVLTGDSDRNLNLSENFTAVDGDSGKLAPGDVWQYNTSDQGDDLVLGDGRLVVVHEPTNTVLLDDGYRVEVVPGGIEFRVESFDHADKQSDQAKVYGEGDRSSDSGIAWNYDVFVDFTDDGEPVKNPDGIELTFDPAAQDALEHRPADHELRAFDPDSPPEDVTVTASVDGFGEEDDVLVSVYRPGTLDVSIDDVTVAQSTNSLSAPPSSAGPPGLSGQDNSPGSLQDSPVRVPNDNTIEVTFTSENNDPAPAPNKTVTLTTQFDSTQNQTVELGTIDAGDSPTETREFTIPPDFTGTTDLTAETDSGNTDTLTLNVVDSLFWPTNIVPNANKQQLTFGFTVDSELPPTGKVTITLTDDTGLSVNGKVKLDDGGEGTVDFTSSSDPIKFTYGEGERIPAGTDVEIRVTDVAVGSSNSGPYNWSLERSDTGLTQYGETVVSRDAGDGGFSSLDVEGFDSTGTQEQTISFNPTAPVTDIDGVRERVAIDLTGTLNALDMSNAQVASSSSNVNVYNENLNSNQPSSLVLELDSYSGGPAEVTLEQIKPEIEGAFEVGFSRGSNDTESETFEIETQKPSPFESVEVTDIVPNGQGQQQLISFTANSSLDESQLPDAGEIIDIQVNAYEPVSGGEGQVAYGGSVATFNSQGQITNQNTNSNGQLTLEYKPNKDLSPGETIEMRATDINVARLDEQADPYEVRVSPSGSLAAENTTFNVTRSGTAGDAGLSTFTVEDLAGTNRQTQNITFEPDGAFTEGKNEKGAVTIELNDALIDSDVNWDGNSISIVEGDGSLNSNNNSEAAYTTYTAPSDGYSKEVTIALDVDPDESVLGESYTVGVSRGTAGTAGATFGVFQPAQFDVTVQDEEAFQGTYYGSESTGLSVTAEVTNTDSYTDTQTVNLSVGGSETEEEVTLDGGESTVVTLSLGSVNSGDGSYTADIESQTDSTTADVRILENTPELLAGFEKNGTEGNTLSVDLNVASFDLEGGDKVGSYAIGFSYDSSILDFSQISAGEWSDDSPVTNPKDGAFAVSGFSFGDPLGTTPLESALTFEFDITSAGTTDINFNDSVPVTPNEIRPADDSATTYDVLFINGTVEAQT